MRCEARTGTKESFKEGLSTEETHCRRDSWSNNSVKYNVPYIQIHNSGQNTKDFGKTFKKESCLTLYHPGIVWD